MTYLLGMLKVQTHFCNYKGAEIKEKHYETSDFKTIRLSNIQTFLKSDTPFQFAYISAPEHCTEKFLYSRRSYGSHLSNELCPSLLACL